LLAALPEVLFAALPPVAGRCAEARCAPGLLAPGLARFDDATGPEFCAGCREALTGGAGFCAGCREALAGGAARRAGAGGRD
jgi:hypothetical protein